MKPRVPQTMADRNQPMQESDVSKLVLADGEITIRPTGAGDEAQLFAWFTDPEIYQWWGGKPKTREYVLRRLSVMIDDDGTAWPFMILCKDEPIGYLQIWLDTDGAAGLDMFLTSAFRGRGLGARVAHAVACHLCDAGWSRLTADPAVDNASAIRMWEKAGFEKTGTIVDIGDGPSELMVFR